MSVAVHPAPKYASNDGVAKKLAKAFGKSVIDVIDAHGEISLTVTRDSLPDVLTALRNDYAYQQLMEIAGADYPARAERFDVCYHLLSVTKNHRIRIRVTTDETTPVPSITSIWPNAGWLEREVYDMYGVIFAGNPDLRRILTDYGFKGHPFRKDFPLSGYVEMRYSEAQKRVIYEPVQLAQDFRSFDFMSPWEGAEYILPGDEKAPAAPPAAPPPPATPPPTPVAAAPKAKAAAKPAAKAKAAAKPKSAAKSKGKVS